MAINYSGPHKLLTLSGTAYGSEIWSMGMRFSGSQLPDQTMVDACATPALSWFTAAGSGFRSTHALTLVKLAPIGADGKYPPGADSVEHVFSTGNVGTYTAGQTWAPQDCMVISLTTDVSRGRAHIGRVYPPSLGLGLAGTGGITSAQANTLLGTFRTMVLALNGVAGMGSLSVFSTFGPVHTVTGLRCGLVVDTQRRRRNKIPETPVALTL